MAEGIFFTNGVPPIAVLTGEEKAPLDAADGSANATISQIGLFIIGKVDLPNAQYNSDGETVDFIPSGDEVAGAKFTALELNGALGADRTLTMPEASEMATALRAPVAQQSYVLRFINKSSAAHKWTIAGSTKGTVSINGNADVTQNTWQDFVVIFNNQLTVATLQNVGGGTA